MYARICCTENVRIQINLEDYKVSAEILACVNDVRKPITIGNK